MDCLADEVNWLELFALNSLREAAPEAFFFLCRNWDELAFFGDAMDEKSKRRRKHIQDEWQVTCKDAEWNPRAAESVIEYLLPRAEIIFSDKRGLASSRLKSISAERYWVRARDERIPESQIPDRVVLGDIQAWLSSHSLKANLVRQLSSSEAYCLAFELLHSDSPDFDSDALEILFEQVIEVVADKFGAESNWQTLGFESLARLYARDVPPSSEKLPWVAAQVARVSSKSLGLAYSLMKLWRTDNSCISDKLFTALRRQIAEALKSTLVNYKTLSQSIGEHNWVRFALSGIVYCTLGEGDKSESYVKGSEIDGVDWRWLGPILESGLRASDPKCLISTASLIQRRNGRTPLDKPCADRTLLSYFFPNDEARIVQLIEQLAGDNSTLASLAVEDRQMVKQIARSLTKKKME